MKCGVCNHEWCWSCGMSPNNKMHNIFGAGCYIFNGFTEQTYKTKCKKCLIIFFVILVIIFAIPMFFILCIGGCMYLISQCQRNLIRSKILRNRVPKKKCLWASFFIILWLFIIIPLCIAIGILGFCLLVGPLIILFLVYVLIILYNWCMRSRTKNSKPTEQ